MFTLSLSESEKDALLALVVSAKDKTNVINDIGLGNLDKCMQALAKLLKLEQDMCVSSVIPNREVVKNGATVVISSDSTIVCSANVDKLLMFFNKKTSDLTKLNLKEIDENVVLFDWFNANYPSYIMYEHDMSLYNRSNLRQHKTNYYTFDYNGGRILVVVYHNDVTIAVSPYIE